MKIKNVKGFSILELLIVLAIIGLLGSLAIYGLNVSRAHSRDAKRASDISVLRSGLNQYWLQKASYPVTSGVDLGKPEAVGLTTEGFVAADGGGNVILPRVPTGPKSNEYYYYKGTLNGYSLKFSTERDTAFGKAGTYYVHTTGVDTQDVEQ